VAKGNAKDDEIIDTVPSSGIERLTNLLALLVVKGHNQTESVKLLSRAGFQVKEIAGLLGSTPNTVSVTLYQAKKNGKKTKGKRGAD
jgi:DNA-binding CsgD family transcriptional regulator